MRVPFKGKILGAPPVKTNRFRCKGTEADVKNINSVAEYASDLGWNIIFEKEGEDGITPALRNITINSSLSKKTQLYALLHECGHAALFESQEKYLKRYPDGYIRYAGKTTKRSNRHKIDVLREEIAAWDTAEAIVDFLGIKVNMRDFHDERNRSLMTYIEWFK